MVMLISTISYIVSTIVMIYDKNSDHMNERSLHSAIPLLAGAGILSNQPVIAMVSNFYNQRMKGLLLGKIHLKGVYKMKKQKNSTDKPTIAEGMNTEDELQKDATPEEISRGEYTNVTTLSLDENDPS